jgi:hypothetical protein
MSKQFKIRNYRRTDGKQEILEESMERTAVNQALKALIRNPDVYALEVEHETMPGLFCTDRYKREEGNVFFSFGKRKLSRI